MIELVFVTCLTAAPTVCERHAMPFTDVTVMACLSGAQLHLARWVGEHPSWRVRQWTCQPAGVEFEI